MVCAVPIEIYIWRKTSGYRLKQNQGRRKKGNQKLFVSYRRRKNTTSNNNIWCLVMRKRKVKRSLNAREKNLFLAQMERSIWIFVCYLREMCFFFWYASSEVRSPWAERQREGLVEHGEEEAARAGEFFFFLRNKCVGIILPRGGEIQKKKRGERMKEKSASRFRAVFFFVRALLPNSFYAYTFFHIIRTLTQRTRGHWPKKN